MAHPTPENPISDAARGEKRVAPQAELVSFDVSFPTLLTVEGIAWGTVMASTITARDLHPDLNADSHVASVILLERIQQSSRTISDVEQSVSLSMSDEELDLLTSRLQILAGYRSVPDERREEFMSALREINEGWIQKGKEPRPAYVDYLKSQKKK